MPTKKPDRVSGDLSILAKIPGRAASAILPDPGGLDAKVVKYVICDACVMLVPCSYCGAPIGELCRGRRKRPTLSCHTARRQAARQPKRNLRAAGMLQGAWRIIFQPVRTEQRRRRARAKSGSTRRSS